MHEIYANATVKQVIFQVRFPSLFYIDAKIGDFQMKLLKKFPQSELLYQRNIMFGVGEGIELEEVAKKQLEAESNNVVKIWRFKTSGDTCQLNVLNSSIDIISSYYKTYASGRPEDNFRDMIDFVIGNFLEIAPIPEFTRIGLRYIDECPLKSLSSITFKKWYNSTFPLSRFKLEDTQQMQVVANVKKGQYGLRYIEAFNKTINPNVLILDFDGSADKVQADQYLFVADDLHQLIHNEYINTIKEPVKNLMRKKQ